jgi:hypothetical protein
VQRLPSMVVYVAVSIILSATVKASDCYETIDPYYERFNVPAMIRIHSRDDVIAVRNAMKSYLWKKTGWPGNKMPISVEICSDSNCNSVITPAAVAGLSLWLDANDAATLSINNGKISQWCDKSGHNNHAVQTADGLQPLYSATGINGRPYIYFDGSDDFLDIADNATLDATHITVFMVLKVANSDNATYPCPLVKRPINQAYLFVVDGSNIPLFRVYTTGVFDAKGTAVVTSAGEIWSGRYDDTSVQMFRNGGQVGSKTAVGRINTTTGTLRIGDGSATNAFCGDISEIIIYNTALSENDRRQVERYLGCKYGISRQPQIPTWIGLIGSDNIGLVERLDVEMDYQMHSYAYLIHPQKINNNRLLIFHMGHSSNLLDAGGQQTMKYFLDCGFSVMAFWMPLFGENSRTAYNVPGYGTIAFAAGHTEMSQKLENSDGSFIRFFVEPVVVAINYVKANYSYRDINMTGISGGGWTTHIVAAIDPRVELSFPVAGSLPLYLRYGPCPNGSLGDEEQYWAAMYGDIYGSGGVANWLDIYILGGYGTGRGQVQILNKYDACCFGGINYQTYEPFVSGVADSLGAGYYYVYLDATHHQHQISDIALSELIYPTAVRHVYPLTCQEAILQGLDLKGDINSDCRVDWHDLSSFAQDWLRCIDPNNTACEKPWLQ